MNLSPFLPLPVAVLIGFFLVSIFWPATRPGFPLSVLKWFLAVGVGIGFSSCLFFLWLLIFSPSGYGLFEIAVLACLAVVNFLKKKKPRTGKGDDFLPFPSGHLRLRRILAFSFFGILGCALLAFILFSVAEPHGGWDA